MQYFKLPDLGEGLQEAEIVRWHIAAGNDVKQDQILVSVETAKAIIDLPSPQDGKVIILYGSEGDIIHVGDPLVEFELEIADEGDRGTVVGKLEIDDKLISEQPLGTGSAVSSNCRATPAVRALATRLQVDLSMVKPSGRDNTVTADDVQRVAKLIKRSGELVPLKGVRRAMALTMARANAEVVAVTINDDADISQWQADDDITTRLICAIVAGCRAEPALNAWYQAHAIARILPKTIDLGIAIDTDQGLFVPILRDVGNRDQTDLRKGLEAIKKTARSRTISPEEMRGSTFTLSNFGTFAGRYANPVVIPPTVAILGLGRIRPQATVNDGLMEMRNCLPLSLTFDHRAVTGGEAARFLAVIIDNIERVH